MSYNYFSGLESKFRNMKCDGIENKNKIIEVDFNLLFIIIPSLSNGGPLSVRTKYFCLLQSVQTGSEFGQNWTKPSIQALLVPSFATVNQRGNEADNSTLPRAEVKNRWSPTSTNHI